MKLINVGEISELLFDKYNEVRVGNEAYFAGKAEAYYDAYEMLIKAKPVDAIPIAWMKKMLEEMNHTFEPHFAFMYVLREWEKTRPIEELQAESEMRDWQKEQEENGE